MEIKNIEEANKIPVRGIEWEVVSLTASTYAASRNPMTDDNASMDNSGEDAVPESFHAMFMSSHFVFPPSEHENLPLECEPVISNTHTEHKNKHAGEEEDKFHRADVRQAISDLIESSEQGLNLPGIPKPREHKSHLPCQAWWKRRAACLYAHAKGVNSFWSICIVAAAMGLIVFGHQWRRERW